MSGFTGGQCELLYALPSAVTKNTFSTQAVISATGATVPACKIPGGLINANPDGGVGKAFMVEACGTIANTAAATFTGIVGFDTTLGTLANSVTFWPILAPTASTTCLFYVQMWITVTVVGTTCTFQVNGQTNMSVVGSGTLSTAPQNIFFQTTVSTSLNADNPIWIELFGTWSASSASNTTTLQQMFLWGLN